MNFLTRRNHSMNLMSSIRILRARTAAINVVGEEVVIKMSRDQTAMAACRIQSRDWISDSN